MTSHIIIRQDLYLIGDPDTEILENNLPQKLQTIKLFFYETYVKIRFTRCCIGNNNPSKNNFLAKKPTVDLAFGLADLEIGLLCCSSIKVVQWIYKKT